MDEKFSKMGGNEILQAVVLDPVVKKAMTRWFELSGIVIDKMMDRGVSEKDSIRALKTLMAPKNAEYMHDKRGKHSENLL